MSARRPCVVVSRTHCCSATGPLCVHAPGQPGRLQAVLLACDAARVAPLPVARPDVWVPALRCLHPSACSHELLAAASLRHCEAVLRLRPQQAKPEPHPCSASGSCIACVMYVLGAHREEARGPDV